MKSTYKSNIFGSSGTNVRNGTFFSDKIDASSMASVGVQINVPVGTLSVVLSLQASLDGTNWVDMDGTKPFGLGATTSRTVTNPSDITAVVWNVAPFGLGFIRVKAVGDNSGDATINGLMIGKEH